MGVITVFVQDRTCNFPLVQLWWLLPSNVPLLVELQLAFVFLPLMDYTLNVSEIGGNNWGIFYFLNNSSVTTLLF